MIKKFEEFALNENKDMSYTDIFGKHHSHDDEFKKSLKDGLVWIRMDENNVSEKAFETITNISNDIENNITDDMLVEAEDMYNKGKRLNFIYEYLYDKYFNQ